jgi:hypothetical protein
MTYKYRISGDDVVFIGVEDVPAQDFKNPIIFWQIVEESCTFQKIYRVGKVKLQTKWPGRFEKTQI